MKIINYKEINCLELLIKELDNSLSKGCLFAALGIALIIPDAFGKYLCPEIEKNGDRYKAWLEHYYFCSYKDLDNGKKFKTPELTPEVIYKLRCSFLHEGSSTGIEKKYEEFNLDCFIFGVENKNEFDIYVDMASFDESDGYSEYRMNIRKFCCDILLCASGALKDIKEKGIQVEKIKILDLDEYLGKGKDDIKELQ